MGHHRTLSSDVPAIRESVWLLELAHKQSLKYQENKCQLFVDHSPTTREMTALPNLPADPTRTPTLLPMRLSSKASILLPD